MRSSNMSATMENISESSLSLQDEKLKKTLCSLLKDVKLMSISNMEYFQEGKHSHDARFHVSFCLLYEHLDIGIEPGLEFMFPKLKHFDACEEVRANGYRSLVTIIQKCCVHILQLSRHINFNRESFFFRPLHYCKEIEAYVSTIGQLRAFLYYAQKLLIYSSDGSLFASDEKLSEPTSELLMMEAEMLNQDCFYGRCLGFQFCDSMMKPLQAVAVAMASFSEGYQETSHVMQLASSLINSGKYFVNPELRARQIVTVTRNADIKFCKAFWSLPETDLMQQLPGLVCPAVQVDEVITLNPTTFEIGLANSTNSVTVTPPCAHSGYSPINIRLISHEQREGQEVQAIFKNLPMRSPSKVLPKCPSLLVHCHGGGFVAQSSKTHEVYLRHWARELKVPILSIDYSLSPEHPFPRALEECFYVYCWTLNNLEKLGTTGERICFAGDSAGGNLITSTAMRAATVGVRCPDGIVAMYTPFMLRYSPSPSRLLALMDPLLPVGILSRCLAAYAGAADEFSTYLADSMSTAYDMNKLGVSVSEDNEEDDWLVVNINKEGDMKKEINNDVDDDLMIDRNAETVSSSSDSDFIQFRTPDSVPDDEKQYLPHIQQGTDYTQIAVDKENTSVDLSSDGRNDLTEQDNIGTASDTRQIKELGVSAETNVLTNDDVSEMTDETNVKTSDQTGRLLGDSPIENNPDSSEETSNHNISNSVLTLDSGCSVSCLSNSLNSPTSAFCGSSLSVIKESLSSPSVSIDSDDNGAFIFSADTVSKLKLPVRYSAENNQLFLDLKRTKKSFHKSPSEPSLNTNSHNQNPPLSTPLYAQDRHLAQSPLQIFRHLPIAKNPYMSPLLAPDEMLKGLPDFYLVPCHLDPILDDSIAFTKRLRRIGKNVDITVVEDLPHGFLNFVLISREAKQASDLCVYKIKKVLLID